MDSMLWTLLALCLIGCCYAEVYYVCFDEEDPAAVDIQCAPGMVLKIEEAGYGRSTWGLCRDLIKTTQDHKCYALTNTTMECCGFSYCDLQVKRTFIKSCDYRRSSFLKIVYECVPEKSRFVCGPPRLNTPTDGTHPVFLPGEHILGDIDYPPSMPTETFTESELKNATSTNTDSNTTNKTSSATERKAVKTPFSDNANAESKTPTKKMAIMMITAPPDVHGYKIVNEDGSEHKPDETWHILHGNDAVAVWACLGVGLLIIFLLTMVLIYLCRRSPDHTKAQEVCPQQDATGPGHHHRNKPLYQESEFGCKRYPDPQQPPAGGGGSASTSPEHNNNKPHKNHPRMNNSKDNNSHINRAFAGDYAHKVGMSNCKKRSQPGGGGRGSAGLIVTPQDPVSACLRSPSSIISLSDDENSSLTDSGVETTSKQGSRQNSRGKDVKKKAAVLKASHNRSGSAKRPTSLDVPPECHRMKVKDTNDIHDIIVL